MASSAVKSSSSSSVHLAASGGTGAGRVGSQVRVLLRVRPFLPTESSAISRSSPCAEVLDCHPATGEVTVHLKDFYTSRNETFRLDGFFGQDSCISEIYDAEICALIPRIFCGFNASVFAYGATGSGKTYTMQGTEAKPGLIPLAMSSILEICKGDPQISVQISYYEIYLERCCDLLKPGASEVVPLDDKDGNVQLKGLSSVPVSSMEEFEEIYSTGVQRRKVGHTGINDASSRSHAVLAITVSHGANKGKLNLIDLAGNEDNRRSNNEGIRLHESAKINQSLFALSNVIYALNNNEPRIPYRESKLTRILQDSLGGSSHALMIACLNPVAYQEAVHTVSLAARSRHIVNHVGSASKLRTPKEKVDMDAKLRVWLESKGKIKGRLDGLFSPPHRATPSSSHNAKQPASARSSVRAMPMNADNSRTKKKIQFDLRVSDSASVQSHEEKKSEEVIGEHQIDVFVGSLDDEKTDVSTGHSVMDWQQLSEDISQWKIDAGEIHQHDSKSNASPCILDHEKISSSKDEGFLGSSYYEDKSAALTNSPKSSGKLNDPKSFLSPSRYQVLLNSPKKVLSPISSNIMHADQFQSDDGPYPSCSVMKTPRRTCIANQTDTAVTPLDKFNAQSSALKESLLEEYLAFLNVASKEELLQIKGIGQRRAEYILELRQDSPRPLKSLADLEKIGLSSKQVMNMFRNAALGIF